MVLPHEVTQSGLEQRAGAARGPIRQPGRLATRAPNSRLARHPREPSIETTGCLPIPRPLPPDSGCTGAGRHERSKQSALSKAEAPGARHNEVVKHPDVDELQRVLQSPGDHLVRRTRLRDAARMIVHQDACGGIMPEGFLHDFPRMDACGIDRAAEEFLAFDDAMPGVEVDDAEDFVRQLAKA